jgi:hypothetical protein
MDFKFVLMALTFMFLINFVAASMSGYNFLDQFTVNSTGEMSYNITFSAACGNALKIPGLQYMNQNEAPQLACAVACNSEMQQAGLTKCSDLIKIKQQTGFGASQQEHSILGSLGDLFATVLTFLGTLMHSIFTFFMVVMQIMIAPKNLGSFNIVLDIINAVSVMVVIAWIWKVILPTASD